MNTCEAAWYWIKPVIHQSQYCLCRMAVVVQRVRLRSSTSPSTLSFEPGTFCLPFTCSITNLQALPSHIIQHQLPVYSHLLTASLPNPLHVCTKRPSAKIITHSTKIKTRLFHNVSGNLRILLLPFMREIQGGRRLLFQWSPGRTKAQFSSISFFLDM